MKMQWHKSTCPYCGLGCGLMVGVKQGMVAEVRGMKGHPTNNGATCSLPINYPPIFTDKDRLTQPMIRRDGELTNVTWEKAISHVASGFNRIIEKHGPDAVAFYGGAINLTEEYYLMNKLMKAAIGTNNMMTTLKRLICSLLQVTTWPFLFRSSSAESGLPKKRTMQRLLWLIPAKQRPPP